MARKCTMEDLAINCEGRKFLNFSGTNASVHLETERPMARNNLFALASHLDEIKHDPFGQRTFSHTL